MQKKKKNSWLALTAIFGHFAKVVIRQNDQKWPILGVNSKSQKRRKNELDNLYWVPQQLSSLCFITKTPWKGNYYWRKIILKKSDENDWFVGVNFIELEIGKYVRSWLIFMCLLYNHLSLILCMASKKSNFWKEAKITIFGQVAKSITANENSPK